MCRKLDEIGEGRSSWQLDQDQEVRQANSPAREQSQHFQPNYARPPHREAWRSLAASWSQSLEQSPEGQGEEAAKHFVEECFVDSEPLQAQPKFREQEQALSSRPKQLELQ